MQLAVLSGLQWGCNQVAECSASPFPTSAMMPVRIKSGPSGPLHAFCWGGVADWSRTRGYLHLPLHPQLLLLCLSAFFLLPCPALTSFSSSSACLHCACDRCRTDGTGADTQGCVDCCVPWGRGLSRVSVEKDRCAAKREYRYYQSAGWQGQSAESGLGRL